MQRRGCGVRGSGVCGVREGGVVVVFWFMCGVDVRGV